MYEAQFWLEKSEINRKLYVRFTTDVSCVRTDVELIRSDGAPGQHPLDCDHAECSFMGSIVRCQWRNKR